MFEWTKECETSFEQLKRFLTSALSLKIADLGKEFVVCIDYFKRGVCGVLMWDRRLVCYQLTKLNNN